MHRSGTSVATRAMETLGASFGNNLLPPGDCNPKGFFEDVDVVALNAELLEAVGVDWHALPAPDLSRLDNEALNRFRERAVALLHEKWQNEIFALKDPRVARLVPFWQPVFDQFHADVRYVVAFRHPIGVARSLETRDRLPAKKAYLLWLSHVVPALRHTANLPRTLINYDAMIEAPEATLARLADELDLTLDPARREIFKRDFLEDSLRHTRASAADLENAEDIPAVVKSLYPALEAFTDAPSPATQQRLDAILSEAEVFLANAAPLMEHDWESEVQLNSTRQRVGELEHANTTQSARVSELEHLLAEANARLEEVAQHSGEEARRAMQAMTIQQRELDRVLTSRSWRITAPIRGARRLFSW
jgi:hypothetical protein